MEIEYALAHTEVHLKQYVDEVIDLVTDSHKTIRRPAMVEVVTVADPHAKQCLQLPRGSASVSTASRLVLTDDRRLAAVEATGTARGPEWIKAGAGLLGTVVAVATSVVNPIAAVGARAMDIQADTSNSGPTGKSPDVEVSKKSPRVPVDPRQQYARDEPEKAELLTALENAEHSLLQAVADQATTSNLATLKALASRQRIVRRYLDAQEADYAVWRASKRTTRTVDVEHYAVAIETLPSTKDLRDYFKQPGHTGDFTPSRPSDPQWAVSAFKTGVAVSVDYASEQPEAQESDEREYGAKDLVVRFRSSCLATVTTWALAAPSEGVEYQLLPTSVTTCRVVRRDAPVNALGLDVDAWRSGSLKITFNEVGEPSEIGGESKSSAPEGLDAVGSSLAAGLETGSGIASSLVPGKAAAEALARTNEMAELRTKLAPPTPAEVELANLKAQVALAKLRAELRAADEQAHKGAATSA